MKMSLKVLIGRLLRTMLTIKNKRISDDNPIPKLIDEKLWYLEKGLSAWQRDQLYSAKQKKTAFDSNIKYKKLLHPKS